MSMTNARAQAVFDILHHEPVPVKKPDALVDIWASDVFNLAKMENTLGNL